MAPRALLSLLLVGLLAGIVSGLEAPDQEAVASSEVSRSGRDTVPKYGQKLRKKPRKLEVDNLELPYRSGEEDGSATSGEFQQPPSSTLPPLKTKHGRVPSKVMVRTHKTTTPTPQQNYDNQDNQYQELTTESSLPAWNRYYQNPYVSRKPSIPPKKYVFNTQGKKVASTPTPRSHPIRRVTTTTTTTYSPPTTTEEEIRAQSEFTFPPYSPVDTGVDSGVNVDAVEESRTLSQTLETPMPPRQSFVPPPQERVTSSRGKIGNSVKLVSGGRRIPVSTTKFVTTSTSTAPPPEESTTYYPPATNYVETAPPPQETYFQESDPSQNSGTSAEQEFETTYYSSPATSVYSSSSPTTPTTPQRPPTTTTVTTTSQTSSSVQTPSSVNIRLSHQSVKGIPLRVTTKTFKPIYRVVTQADAADANERKPELELIREVTTTSVQTPTISTAPVSSSSAALPSSETTATLPDSTPSSVSTSSPTLPSTSSPQEEPEQEDDLPPLLPQFVASDGKNTKNKVHYIITVIDPPKKDSNTSGESASSKTSVDLGEKTEEYEEEADEDDFPFADFLTTPPTPREQQQHQLVPVSSSASGSDQDSFSHEQLLQRFKSLNIQAPDFIQDAINSPKFTPSPSGGGREEQIFHFSSDRPYQHVAPSRNSPYTANFIVEEPHTAHLRQNQHDNTQHRHQQNVVEPRRQSGDFKSQFIQSIPLRSVLTYQPEPSSEGSDLFTAKSVAFYTELGPDGKIEKQLLKSPHGGRGHALSFDNVPQFLSRFTSENNPARREQRGVNAVPAQSYYLEQVAPRRDGVREQPQVREQDYDEDNLRTIPFTVDLVPV